MTKKPPSDLGSAGAAYWRTIARAWRLDEHQPEILKQACGCLDAIAGAEADVKKFGAVCSDRFGQRKPNPSTLIIRDNRALFARLIRELNLSAATQDTRPPGIAGRYKETR